jgi:hypothetical protein
MDPDNLLNVCFLDIAEKSVWRVTDWEWSPASGNIHVTLKHLLGKEEDREVELAWLHPEGHYRQLNEMEVLAWLAK